MIKKTKFISALVFITIIFLGVYVMISKNNKKNDNKVFTTGLTKGQSEYFQQQMNEVGVQYGYIQKGNYCLERGDIEKAIEWYETAEENAYSHPTRAEAIFHLANAYEKKRDYNKALEYVILDRDKYVNDWAREPIVERAKYLEYALAGEYELAIEHAQKAIEADMKININGKPRSDYIERLNDLKASKEYIQSLKK
jgi:tetratricopeptide (TPR) repeat protein